MNENAPLVLLLFFFFLFINFRNKNASIHKRKIKKLSRSTFGARVNSFLLLLLCDAVLLVTEHPQQIRC